MENILEIKNIYKSYQMGKIGTVGLDNISLNIKKGEIIVILGPSGSGKTTLLNVISGLDKISKGSILYEGKNIAKYSDRKMTKFRKSDFNYYSINDVCIAHFL